MQSELTDLTKTKIALRHYFRGSGMLLALRAMEFAEERHTGLRKDGVTPEFEHQVRIVGYLLTLGPSLLKPELTFATGFVHDTVEDTDTTLDDVEEALGYEVRVATALLTKQFGTEKAPIRESIAALAENPIASVVKGADRLHNFSSMVGVFSAAKQRSYIEEGTTHIIPMLKVARRRFPAQALVYENLKFVLEMQVSLLEAALDAGKES